MPPPQFNGDKVPVEVAIDDMVRRILRSLFVMLPVEVIAFDAELGCVDVIPLVADVDADNSRIELPEIRCAGILWPGSGGGFEQTHTIAVNDSGYALFASRSISAWLVSGGARKTPEGDRMGSLTDAVFIPGAFHFAAPPAGLGDMADEENPLWRLRKSASTFFEMSETVANLRASLEVVLGNTATALAPGIATLIETEFGKVIAALDAIAAAVPTTNPYQVVGSLGATKTRVE